MKVSKEFILREIADEYILVPIGEMAATFNGLITVNEIGALIFNLLLNNKSVDEIVTKILSEYDVDEQTAREDVNEFIGYLKEKHIIVEE